MRHGPCGGAQTDGSCEVPDTLCPFLVLDGLSRPAGISPYEPMELDVPRMIVDFRPDPSRQGELAEAASVLSQAGVAVLIGEHVDDLTSHRPSAIAETIASHGLAVVSTLTCRDRNIEQMRVELDELASIDPLAVHCVTGDHPAARLDPGMTARFDLDSIELTAMARAAGLVVSVAESPAAAHRGWRPERLLDKQQAGASLAILNHAGDADQLIEFSRSARDVGVRIPLVAPVPVITDFRSAQALDRFPGLALPTGITQRILAAADPRREGISAAVELADQLLDSGHFAAVNLSGAATAGGAADRAELIAEIARRIET